MSQMKSSEMDENLINKIISAAYKDATLSERLLIMWKARKNPEVKRLYSEYKKTAGMVHQMKEESCPESISMKAIKSALKEEKKSHSLLLDLYAAIFSKPVWSAAMAAVIISAVSFSIFLRQHEQTRPQYSQKEIELANGQAAMALKMVGDILNETKSTVISEILPEKVSKPINKSLTVVRNLIDKENTNEKIN